jgi:hypothetical protein
VRNYFILAAGGGVLIRCAVALVSGAKCRRLMDLFEFQDNLIGKSRERLIAGIGEPSVIHRQGQREFLTWHASHYRITLRFSGGVCEGIEGETTWM